MLGPMSMVMIGPRMLNDDVFGGGGAECRGVNARGARRMMMPRRLNWLRGRCSLWRGALLLLGLMASANPAAVAAIAATTTATPNEAAAAQSRRSQLAGVVVHRAHLSGENLTPRPDRHLTAVITDVSDDDRFV